MDIADLRIKVDSPKSFSIRELTDADKGCAFNHDPMKVGVSQSQPERCVNAAANALSRAICLLCLLSTKKHLNVDSPSFTPSSLTANGFVSPPKSKRLSPKSANAAPFKPKGLSSGRWLQRST